MSEKESNYVRGPLPGDHIAIGRNLRPEDVREIEGLMDVPPFLVVKDSIDGAHWCRVAVVDDLPSIVMGVTRVEGYTDSALCWLMSTPGIYKVRRRFLRESADWIAAAFDSGPFNCLYNIVDTRNAVHMKWLKWIGAILTGDPIHKHYRSFHIRR